MSGLAKPLSDGSFITGQDVQNIYGPRTFRGPGSVMAAMQYGDSAVSNTWQTKENELQMNKQKETQQTSQAVYKPPVDNTPTQAVGSTNFVGTAPLIRRRSSGSPKPQGALLSSSGTGDVIKSLLGE